MPRCQHRKMVDNSQDNMSPLEPSYPTTTGTEYFNTAEAQEKDIKAACMKMMGDLKEQMIESLKEIHENTNSVR